MTLQDLFTITGEPGTAGLLALVLWRLGVLQRDVRGLCGRVTQLELRRCLTPSEVRRAS